MGRSRGGSDPAVMSSRVCGQVSNSTDTRPHRSQPIIGTADQRMRESKTSHSYRVYGIALKSRFSLSCPLGTGPALGKVELVEAPASLFEKAWREATANRDSKHWFHHRRLANGSDYLRWRGLFEFLISADGRRIACGSSCASSWETFQTYLVGQVVSFALLKN